MKKFLLSGFVIFSFLAYAFYQKSGTATMPIITPPQAIGTPTPSAASAQTGTQAPTTTSQAPTATPTTTAISKYKDGSFTGDVADALYGNLQVQAIIQNGKITDVKFLQYPSDRSTSRYINSQADPMLTQEAIQAQSANVNIISGATASSEAFIQSLQSALSKAQG